MHKLFFHSLFLDGSSLIRGYDLVAFRSPSCAHRYLLVYLKLGVFKMSARAKLLVELAKKGHEDTDVEESI